MNSPDHNCGDCVHAMDGADNVLRCRIHSNALKCSPAAYQNCKRFELDPGSDDEPMVWLQGGWCVTPSTEGRGD